MVDLHYTVPRAIRHGDRSWWNVGHPPGMDFNVLFHLCTEVMYV